MKSSIVTQKYSWKQANLKEYKMFDSENTVSLDQINQTENLFGNNALDFSNDYSLGGGQLLSQDLGYADFSNFAGESEPGIDSLASADNQDLLTGNTANNSLVGELQPDDSLLATEASAETITLPGVNDKISIEIDVSGIPHIKAQSDQDALFAQGYMHARDRLFQMEYARREASGTLAEVLGKDYLDSDIQSRTRGNNQLAETTYQNLNPETKEFVDAYTAGINNYLTNNPLPAEFKALGYQPEPWQATDVMLAAQVNGGDGGEFNHARLLELGLSQERIEELEPEREDSPTIIQPEDIPLSQSSTTSPTESVENTQLLTSSISEGEWVFPESAEPEYNSNNWVISGSKTTTGKPFLANDPHGDLNSPSQSYQTELESPNLDVVGISSPGIPGIIIGRNNDIAWGETSSQVDTDDYYLLEETKDGSGYMYQGKVKPYEITDETIQVKDSESVTIQVKETVYGPEVSDLYGLDQPVALKSVTLEPNNGLLEAIVGVNQASNWEEFKGSVESLKVPRSNFVYADVEGNIGYIAPGKYPIRQPGHTGEYPVSGTGEFDWQGFIPPEDVPQVYNPESGFIVTANNKITPDNYPYEINGEFDPGYRAERINELINSKDKLSLEDMQSIQLDQVSLLYRDLKPILEKTNPTSEQGKYWRDRLLTWDGNLSLNSQEATVFESWFTELTKLPASEVGQEYYSNPTFIIKSIQTGDPAIDHPGSQPGAYDEVAQAFEAGIERFGDSIPAWGDIHKASFEPLNPEQSEEALQVPYGGGNFTVNVSPYDEQNFIANTGARYRQIVDLSNPDNSLYINPSGQGSDP
ncbi:MAG: penicillin acylase family protein, partial [Waterburya sp.]